MNTVSRFAGVPAQLDQRVPAMVERPVLRDLVGRIGPVAEVLTRANERALMLSFIQPKRSTL
jgi:hypothetical protein